MISDPAPVSVGSELHAPADKVQQANEASPQPTLPLAPPSTTQSSPTAKPPTPMSTSERRKSVSPAISSKKSANSPCVPTATVKPSTLPTSSLLQPIYLCSIGQPPPLRLIPEAATQNQAAQSQLAQNQLAQNQLVQNQLAQNQLAQTQLTQSQLTQNQLAQNQVAQNQLAQNQLAQNQLAQNQLAQNQLAQNQLAQNQLAQTQLPQNQLAQNQLTQNQLAQNQLAQAQLAQSQLTSTVAGEQPFDYRTFQGNMQPVIVSAPAPAPTTVVTSIPAQLPQPGPVPQLILQSPQQQQKQPAQSPQQHPLQPLVAHGNAPRTLAPQDFSVKRKAPEPVTTVEPKRSRQQSCEAPPVPQSPTVTESPPASLTSPTDSQPGTAGLAESSPSIVQALTKTPDKEKNLQNEYIKIWKKLNELQRLDELKERERVHIATKKEKAAQLLRMIKDQVQRLRSGPGTSADGDVIDLTNITSGMDSPSPQPSFQTQPNAPLNTTASSQPQEPATLTEATYEDRCNSPLEAEFAAHRQRLPLSAYVVNPYCPREDVLPPPSTPETLDYRQIANAHNHQTIVKFVISTGPLEAHTGGQINFSSITNMYCKHMHGKPGMKSRMNRTSKSGLPTSSAAAIPQTSTSTVSQGSTVLPPPLVSPGSSQSSAGISANSQGSVASVAKTRGSVTTYVSQGSMTVNAQPQVSSVIVSSVVPHRGSMTLPVMQAPVSSPAASAPSPHGSVSPKIPRASPSLQTVPQTPPSPHRQQQAPRLPIQQFNIMPKPDTTTSVARTVAQSPPSQVGNKNLVHMPINERASLRAAKPNQSLTAPAKRAFAGQEGSRGIVPPQQHQAVMQTQTLFPQPQRHVQPLHVEAQHIKPPAPPNAQVYPSDSAYNSNVRLAGTYNAQQYIQQQKQFMAQPNLMQQQQQQQTTLQQQIQTQQQLQQQIQSQQQQLQQQMHQQMPAPNMRQQTPPGGSFVITPALNPPLNQSVPYQQPQQQQQQMHVNQQHLQHQQIQQKLQQQIHVQKQQQQLQEEQLRIQKEQQKQQQRQEYQQKQQRMQEEMQKRQKEAQQQMNRFAGMTNHLPPPYDGHQVKYPRVRKTNHSSSCVVIWYFQNLHT